MLCVVLLLFIDDSSDCRKLLPSAFIPSMFLTASMFPSVVRPPAKQESVSDRLTDLPSVLTDCLPLRSSKYQPTRIDFVIELCQTPGYLLQFTEGSVKLNLQWSRPNAGRERIDSKQEQQIWDYFNQHPTDSCRSAAAALESANHLIV